MSENHFDLALEELTDRSVGKLLKTDVFDESAFDALREHIWRKSEGLKQETCISKQILSSLRSASNAINGRADHLPVTGNPVRWARDFEEMLDRLIAGEVRSDRKPGIPRLI